MVSIVKANYFNTGRQLERALRLIGYEPKKDRVVLKPNGASAYGHYLLGDYTAPQVLEAFIRLFPGREIVIAEGSAVGMKFGDAARVLGYSRLARKYGNVRLVDLEKEERVELDWKFGKIRIPRIVLESEYVNCPKMKTHTGCTVTLGTKNQKGLLDENTKKKFHRMDLHEAVMALGEAVRPDLTIVDGVIALEGNGPNSITARTKPMGVLVAGRDMTEVDNACIRLMKIPRDLVKHVPRGEVKIAGARIERVARKFAPPEKSGNFSRFGNAYFSAGCSGCLESLSGGLRNIVSPDELPRMPGRMTEIFRYLFIDRVYIFMGKNNSLPEKSGKMVCLGNCTKKFAEENGIEFFPGCPPDAKSLTRIFDL